jgi:acetylornithine deacetylase/succinyl-diaminopimelate desuccinylase-like protein
MGLVADRRSAHRAATRLIPGAVHWLERWLEIPSVSGDPGHRADLDRAAAFVVDRLRRSAAIVEVRRTRTGPVVLARCRGRSPEAVVIYGHLDVKPAGPGWSGPAFRPRRHGDRLIARGASDDKGQLLAHLLAVEAWVAAGGLPRDVIVVIDGAEEIGSPGLDALIAKARRTPVLAGPVVAVVVSDTRMAAPGVPSLTVAQRGMLALGVTVDAGGPAAHAGRLGGAVLDPAQVLAAALARAAGAVTALRGERVPAFVPVPDAQVRDAARGRATHAGRLGLRTTVRGALTVTSLTAGGPPGAVPRRASATLDVRLPPGVRPEAARRLVTRELTRADVAPLRTTVRCTAGTRGFAARHAPGVLAAVREACRDGFGTEPVLLASGGTIPAALMLEAAFGVPPILLGLGPVDDGAHGPDEYLGLADWTRGVHTAVSLLEKVSRKCVPNESGGQPSASGREVDVRTAGLVATRSAGNPGHGQNRV